MSPSTDRDALRATLASFDARRQKVVGGVLAVMFKNPGRVCEREWISEQFTHIALMAGDFEGVGSTDQGVDVVQTWARENVDEVLNACYALFQCVGEDMAPRAKAGFTLEDAMEQALGYFG